MTGREDKAVLEVLRAWDRVRESIKGKKLPFDMLVALISCENALMQLADEVTYTRDMMSQANDPPELD